MLKQYCYGISVVLTLFTAALAIVFWSLAILPAAGISAAIAGTGAIVWGAIDFVRTVDGELL